MTDTSDFDELFRQYYEPLFHFAHQFICDDEDCHDIVSSAYESVWNNYASIEKDCAKRYLYAIVKNKAIDFLRKNNHRRSYVKYVSVMGEHEISSERLGERDDELKIIRQILEELGSPTGEILRACYIEEKSYKEVAEERDISIATVKKHIVKALKYIRNIKKNIKNVT